MKRKIQTVNGKLQENDRKRLARQFLSESNCIPIVDVSGSDLTVTGRNHWFRWLGRFKTYPGSYQHSTRQIELGKDWAANVVEPKGCVFYWDSVGFCVFRRSDGLDYHPTRRECGAKNFVTLVRKGLAEKYKMNLAWRKNNQETIRFEKIYQKEAPKCRVTLDDSRKAGNCTEGSLNFAQRFLHLNREEILQGGYLYHISAAKLLATKDSRAEKAVRVAFKRETMVCI